MKILVIGSGGREHALCWKLAQSSQVSTVYCAPGNAGTAIEPKVKNCQAAGIEAWLALAKRLQVTYTLVGPEQPLADGIVDAFYKANLPIVGPRRLAAQLETSKYFAKTIMQKAGVPTARFRTFLDSTQAHAYLAEHGAPVVIKANGLAAGKGVVVAQTLAEANEAVERIMIAREFGDAGIITIVEDCIVGEEASFIVLTDGKTIAPLNSSQDHKNLQEGDKGPNTGGMGAYAPAPVLSPKLQQDVLEYIMMPLLSTLKQEMPFQPAYCGFLYAGLMICDGKPQVLEFNCRMGDPETQPLMFGLNADLAVVLYDLLQGELSSDQLSQSVGATLGVVLAAKGYPYQVHTGAAITGLEKVENLPDVKIFHSGTQRNQHTVNVSGGRVLCVTARGDSLQQAHDRAYKACESIHFEGMQYRQDIGYRAL